MEKPCVQLNNITKRYPGVVALDDVSVSFLPGEVHALMGENGAGKSTLIKILAGAIPSDGGTVTIGTQSYTAMTPKVAAENGIQVIYQELNLVNGMSVMDNIFAGMPLVKHGFQVDFAAMEQQSRDIFQRLGVQIDPRAIVGSLPTAYQQMVEIGKSLIRDPKLLVMDEPTSVLSNNEVDILFAAISRLREEGVTVIYISHRMEEIFRIADRVTVLRDGKYITTQNVADVDRAKLIQFMVGRELTEQYPVSGAEASDVVLEAEHISGFGFHDVSFRLRRGEILGLAGLVGAGRTETVRGIVAATPLSGGQLCVKGKAVSYRSPKDAIRDGIALLPEDRKLQGLVLPLSIMMNADVVALRKVSSGGVLNRKKERQLVQEYIDKLSIKTPDMQRAAQSLSGGNQQKVVLAKWLCSDCDIFIFDEPTRGIDVGAKHEIYNLMCELAREGKAILMISSDMEELLGMSDRIVVMSEGTITGELTSRKEFSQNKVLEYASGHH